MRILQSDLALQGETMHTTRQEERHHLQRWRGEPPPQSGTGEREPALIIRLSEEAQRLAAAVSANRTAAPPAPPASGQASDIDAAFEAAEKDPYVQLIRSMIEFLTGRPVTIRTGGERQATSETARADGARAAVETPEAAPDFGMIYRRQVIREEYTATRFQAEGTVQTADGQNIRFSLSLAFERTRRTISTQEILAGNAVRKDPLVINFAGSAALLGDGLFRFDLDGDGETESLSAPAAGTAFLVFDRNANGQVDDRSELFGPQTDNGFVELAALDADGNGWIDEADPAFAQLGLWQPDAAAGSTVSPLAAHEIGAIATASAATRFDLLGKAGDNLGLLRRTGVALTEDARTIAVHELDLTLR